MVKHLILWKLKEEYSDEEKAEIKKSMKSNLESLVGKVPGLTEMTIHIDYLPSSTADAMLESVFESEEALKGYSKHPAHVEVANTYVRPFTATRLCLDYEI